MNELFTVKEGQCDFCLKDTYIIETGSNKYCQDCYNDKLKGICYRQKKQLDEDMEEINRDYFHQAEYWDSPGLLKAEQFEELKNLQFHNGLDLAGKEMIGHVPSAIPELQNYCVGFVGDNISPSPPNLNSMEVKMEKSGSQSRFSIIDSLTEKKVTALNEIESLKANTESLKLQITRTKEDTEKALARKIEDLNQAIKNNDEQIKNKKEIVSELDKGIKAIESVSKETSKKE